MTGASEGRAQTMEWENRVISGFPLIVATVRDHHGCHGRSRGRARFEACRRV